MADGMNSFIASVATADDAERIKVVVENSTLSEYQRCAALQAFIIMYSEGKYPRAELVDYLCKLLEMFVDDMDFVSWVANECKNVSATEHYARIRNLFKNDKIDTFIIGDEYFAEDVPPKSEEEVLKHLEKDPHISIITDTIESMQRWHCFNDKKPLVPKGREKVGRNEPCPCNSGKKYKKCCLPLL
jgi:preprotein translocase subunit SecA